MGKGHKWRKTDYKKFFDNFDGISFKKKKKEKTENVEVVKAKGKTIYKYS